MKLTITFNVFCLLYQHMFSEQILLISSHKILQHTFSELVESYEIHLLTMSNHHICMWKLGHFIIIM